MNLCLPEITLMENALLENDSNTWPKGDVSLKLDLEMTQCNAEERKKKRRKEKRKTEKKNQTSNSLKSKDIDDNLPNGTSIKASPVKVDSILHPSVSTCLSTDLEITQHDAEVILSQNVDNGKKKNSRHNVLTSNDTDQNFQNGGCQPSCYLTNTEFVERVDGNSVSEVAEQLPSFQKCLDASSTKKHDDQTQVDTSLDLSSAKPNQRKKQNWREKRKLSDSSVTSLVSIKEVAPPSLLVVQDASSTKKHDDQAQVDTSLDLSNAKPNQRKKQNRREKRKLSDSSVTSLVSIKEVAPPSLLVVQDSSVRDTSLNHSHEAYASGCSDEIMGVGEVVAERGTLKGINTDQSVVNDASRVDLPDDDQAQRKKRVRRNRRKRRKLFDSSVTSLGSINNVASPSLLVVQEASASASASASGCSDKMMGVREVVAEHGTSLLVTTGGISLDKASGECPVCEPASGEQEKKVEMANLKGINADQSVVNDASRVDLPDDDQAQRKKRAKRNWRTKTKLFDSSVTSLGSIKEVASSSLLVVQEAYASACGCSDKMKGVGEVVAERGTSLLVTTGGISLDKASDECPDSKPASGEHKKVELENLKRINNEQCVVNDASRVDLRNFFCEHGNGDGDKDKPHVIHSAVLDDDQATKPNQRKKRVKSNKRIRGKFSDSGVTSLGSIKEAASPSVLVVQDSSVRDTSLNHSDEAYASGCTEKMMGVGEMVAEHGTSLLVRGHISLGKASGEFPDGEPASGEQERKVELENNASWVDPQENFCEHANGDKEKPNVIQNAVLDDDRVQIDATFDVGSTKPCQGKKRVKSNKRKRGKLSDSGVTSLGSILEAASPSVLVVQDSSVRDTSLNHSDKAYASCCSEKMMGVGEVVAEHGTSLLVRGHISLGKASGEFPDDEPASREQEKKVEMENLKVINNEQSVVNDASQVDLSEISFEHDKRDKDKPNVIQNAVLDVSAEEIFHKSTTFYKDNEASDDASGSDPSVENLEYDNLGIQPKLKDAIPSSSQFGTMTDDDHDVSLAVIGKEGPRQRLQSSLRVPPDNLKKKLLVLDVNGLLADIFPYVSGRRKPDTVISQKAVFKRPFCDDFLQFCFERFCVGVWSSRTKKNVESVIGFLMGNFKHNLLFCWNQSHCTRTGFYTVENKEKPLVLKEIKKLWEKRDRNLPWKRGEYNESNTLLLDDSPYKALCNPPHTAIFPHSYQYKNVKDNSLGPGGDLRVYLEGLAMADNVRKYVELNPFGQRPITKTNLSWEYYLKVISSISSPKEEDAQ